MRVGLPLMKIAVTPIIKNVLLPLGVTAAASATDSAIQKRIAGSRTELIISNEEMKDIMKIGKPLQESDLLIKDVGKTIENEAKEQKGRFLGMLLRILVASSFGNMLSGKGVI